MISVWAPVAVAVEIEWSGDGAPVAREAMSRDDDGWWHWDGDPAAYQTFDYAFVLDDAGQRDLDLVIIQKTIFHAQLGDGGSRTGIERRFQAAAGVLVAQRCQRQGGAGSRR